MFSIYGISGPVFQGTLENLSRLTPVVRRAPAIAARRVGDQIEPGVAPAQTYAMSASGLGEEAVDAYQAMLPQNLERGPLYQANQIMQTQVITVNADDDVARAWHVLIKNQIHQAPVLDAGLSLVGIVSDRNLLTALDVGEDQVHNALSKRVSDVMTTPVVAASPVTDIRHIAQVMLDHDVSGVPIVNDAGRLLGIISLSDILRAVATDPPLSIWL
jgi:acetoin utilization protein AcuB